MILYALIQNNKLACTDDPHEQFCIFLTKKKAKKYLRISTFNGDKDDVDVIKIEVKKV